MKNLLGNKSHVADVYSRQQSNVKNFAMIANFDNAQHESAKFEKAALDYPPIDLDEMQIDKLYQSL